MKLCEMSQLGSTGDATDLRPPVLVPTPTIDTFDDSAYAFRSDADFASVGALTVEEREDARAHNDMVVLCSSVAISRSPGSRSASADRRGRRRCRRRSSRREHPR